MLDRYFIGDEVKVGTQSGTAVAMHRMIPEGPVLLTSNALALLVGTRSYPARRYYSIGTIASVAPASNALKAAEQHDTAVGLAALVTLLMMIMKWPAIKKCFARLLSSDILPRREWAASML